MLQHPFLGRTGEGAGRWRQRAHKSHLTLDVLDGWPTGRRVHDVLVAGRTTISSDQPVERFTVPTSQQSASIMAIDDVVFCVAGQASCATCLADQYPKGGM